MPKQPDPLDKLIPRDPAAAYRRKAIAARRIGDRRCDECGEDRPEALITNSDPTSCFACDRKRKGETVMDAHHVFGKANSPVTIPTPVNDHCAELSTAQRDWPKEIQENPDGCPVLAGAARVLGFIDYVVYLIRYGLRWVAEMLLALSAYLKEKLGPKWWIGTPLEQFAPKR
jgi:hypothetical protein